jgi:hypothetical protein
MTNPALPTGQGCASQDGYVHDAQCLVYRGPDTKYVGHEICYGYNEDTLTMYEFESSRNAIRLTKPQLRRDGQG